MDVERAYERLTQMIDDGGLKAADDLRDRLEQALPLLTKWLQGPKWKVLRATQVLLVDVRRPGVQKQAAVRAVANSVSKVWKTAGTAEGLPLLQRALMAAWPEAGGSDWARGVPRLLAEAWALRRYDEHYSALLELWWEEIPAYQRPRRSRKESATPNFERGENPMVAAGPRGSLTHLDSVKQSNQHYSAVGPHIFTMLKAADDALSLLWAEPARQFETRVESGSAEEVALLWWGQARYSTTLDASLRTVDPDERLSVAVKEVWELARYLPFSPTASYLVEVLHALGDPWDDERSLLEWLEALDRHRAHLPDFESNPAGDDPSGLPVLALLGGMPLSEVPDKTNLPADQRVTRSRWVAMVLGELMLARALS